MRPLACLAALALSAGPPNPAALPDASPTVRGAVNTGAQQYKGAKVDSDAHTVAADAGAAYVSTCVARVVDLGVCPRGNGLQCVADAGWYGCNSDAGWAPLVTGPVSVVGGSSPQVQFNHGGVLGGMGNVVSDGTHLGLLPEATPPAPDSGVEFYANTQFVPMQVDSYSALPMPLGFEGSSGQAQMGNTSNWRMCWAGPNRWNDTAFTLATGSCLSTDFTTEGSGASGGGWDAGVGSSVLYNRIAHVDFATSTSANTWGGERQSGGCASWRGNVPDAGGFYFSTRAGFPQHQILDRTFIGLAATSSPFTGGLNPSVLTNAVYFGCDPADSNLNICSADSSTNACTSLGSSYPCKTNGPSYDFYLSSRPNGSSVEYAIVRLDSAAGTNGSMSVHLPGNVFQLCPHVVIENADSGVAAKIDVAFIQTIANQ